MQTLLHDVLLAPGSPEAAGGIAQGHSRTAGHVDLLQLPTREKREEAAVRRPEGEEAGTRGSKFLSSTREEFGPAYSPDGKRVAFSSNRGGLQQIWVAHADGSKLVPLTSFENGSAGTARWSPDGQMIAFDARPEGSQDIYVMRADGGALKRLTDHRASDSEPCWSADGHWLYFKSNRTGRGQIHRIPAVGGEVQQVTKNGGGAPAASRYPPPNPKAFERSPASGVRIQRARQYCP